MDNDWITDWNRQYISGKIEIVLLMVMERTKESMEKMDELIKFAPG